MALEETFSRVKKFVKCLSEEKLDEIYLELSNKELYHSSLTQILHDFREFPIDLWRDKGTRCSSTIHSIAVGLMNLRLVSLFGLSKTLDTYYHTPDIENNRAIRDELVLKMQKSLTHLAESLMDCTKVHDRELLALKQFHPDFNVEFLVLTYIAVHIYKVMMDRPQTSPNTAEHVIRNLWILLQKQYYRNTDSVENHSTGIPYFEWLF